MGESTTQPRVLVVDDEPSMREFLTILLEKIDHPCDTAADAKAAIQMVDGQRYAVVITDLKMPGELGGLDVLRHVLTVSPSTQVIVMTAFATPETAIEALKDGAYDYLTKPFKIDQIRAVVERAMEKAALLSENLLLRHKLEGRRSRGNIIGSSDAMREVFSLVERVAPTRTTVLLQGESGTGKELVAHAIHEASGQSGTFVPVNCGAIPESLIESELFGYVKGAFTGAETDHSGLFTAAHGGTLFLDEVGELPSATQVRLLRVLQDKRVKPVGGVKEIEVDVRIIAATNRNLREEVEADRFREDLFYRLNVITIELPPLRARRSDIRALLEHFIAHYSSEIGSEVRGIDKDALALLMDYDYPGNVRELQNIVERAVTLERSEFVTPESLPSHVRVRSPRAAAQFVLTEEGVNLDDVLDSVANSLLEQALERTNGNRTEAAKLLGISFRSIRYRLAKLEGADADD